jgi:hypothetical protein
MRPHEAISIKSPRSDVKAICHSNSAPAFSLFGGCNASPTRVCELMEQGAAPGARGAQDCHPRFGRGWRERYCIRCTVTPPHCFSPIAAQDATVWSKFRLTLPLVVKLFITNFEQLALLLAVLPSVTTLEFPR